MPKPPSGYCAAPYVSLYLLAPGVAPVCCRSERVVGHANTVDDLGAIFNGDEMKTIRRAVAEGEFPDVFCEKCYDRGMAVSFDAHIFNLGDAIWLNSRPELAQLRQDLEMAETAAAALPATGVSEEAAAIRREFIEKVVPFFPEAEQPWYRRLVETGLALGFGGALPLGGVSSLFNLLAKKVHATGDAYEALKLGDFARDLMPLEYHVETTSRCNLKCTMCPHSLPPEQTPFLNRGDVSEEILDKIEAHVDAASTVRLSGLGEPTMHRGFEEYYRRYKRQKVRAVFTTNATRLTPRVIETLVQEGIDGFDISIDGATKETFEKVRAGSNFDIIIKNVRHLMARMREKELNPARIHFQMVTMQQNYREMAGVVELVGGLGGKSLSLTPLSVGSDDWTLEYFRDQSVAFVPADLFDAALRQADEATKEYQGFRLMYNYEALRQIPAAYERFRELAAAAAAE